MDSLHTALIFAAHHWQRFLWLAYLGAFFNWFFRGGGIEIAFLWPYQKTRWVGKLIEWGVVEYTNDYTQLNFKGGRYINALAYGVTGWLSSGLVVSFVLLALFMAAGQGMGWSKAIGALRGQKPNGKGVLWGIAMLTGRGSFWGLCLAWALVLGYAYCRVKVNAVAFFLVILGGAAQGVIYWAVVVIYRRFRLKQDSVWNDWTDAEKIHGAFLWLPLGFI